MPEAIGSTINDNRTAVVTGGARGAGAAIARRLAQDGLFVVIGDLDVANAEITAQTLRKEGLSVSHCQLDVADESSVENLAETAANLGQLAAWINNAAIPGRCPFLELTTESWDQQMTINARGTFLGTRAAAKRMIGGGSIVNITSISCMSAYPNIAHYGASKGAVAALTNHAAVDLAPLDIRVNAVAPGTMRTAMTETRLSNPEQLQWTISRVPLRRLAQTTDIAAAVAFLCRDEAAYITGTVIVCDGGLTAAA